MLPPIALDRKLTLDAREAQLLRIQRMRIASAASVGVLLLLLLAQQTSLLSLQATLAMGGMVLLQVALFGAAFTSGLNRRFKDPSLTTPQTLGSALVMILTAHYADPQARTFALLTLPLLFAFASFRFGTQAMFRLGFCIVAMAAIEAIAAMLLPPARLGLGAALLNLGALSLTLAVMSVIGGSMNDLRRDTQFERAMAGQAIDKLAEAVVAVGVDGRVQFLNAGAARLLALADTDVNQRSLDELFTLDGERSATSLLNEYRNSPEQFAQTPIVAKIRGTDPKLNLEREVEICISSINGQRGADVGYVMVLRDVTEHYRLLRELEHAATHDDLTRLQNRRGFAAQLARLLSDRTKPTSEHALLLLDLDQFKIVNDTCGHQAGDDLLCAVASILRARFANAHCLARLGGDEFGVLLCDIDAAQTDVAASQLLQALTDFRFARDDRVFIVSASIGVTALRNGANVDEVMAQADAACYLAKEMGRRQVRRYSPDAQDLLRHQTEMHWVTRINDALTNNRFTLYGQRIAPAQVDPHDLPEFELLIRMIADDGSIISPDQFLPAAERFNLMPAIDRWVIAKAVDQLVQVVTDGGVPPKVAINVSASSMRDDSLAMFIADRITASGLTGDLFTFELTESAAVTNFALASDFIMSVQALGCRVALDDVGTGFCSFAHLQILPVDQIKIDGSFVRSVCENRLDRVLVESLQRIAGVLGVTTVAEYVENDKVSQTLRAMGIDFLQGYGVHRPEPLHGLLTSAAANGAVASAGLSTQAAARTPLSTRANKASVLVI